MHQPQQSVFRAALIVGAILALTPLPIAAAETATAETATAEMASRSPDLAGVWVARHTFGDAARGPLYLVHRGEEWTAEIAGSGVVVVRQGDELRFALPGDRGSFRGALEPGGEIVGHWIQPAPSQVTSQAQASPLTLRPAGSGVWQGEVGLLADRLTLFLTLSPSYDGSLTASLRNPERNLGAFVIPERLEVDSDRVRLIGRYRWSDDEQVLAEGERREDGFSLAIPDLGGTYDFAPIAAGSNDYLPGRGEVDVYRYRQPVALDDGWPTAAPEEVGMQRGPLEELVRRILATPMNTLEQPYVHAVLVARRGRLVLEEYFHGYHRDHLHDTRSASKSVTSLLAGAAIQSGAPLALDTRVYATMRPGVAAEELPPGAAAMTLRHLMTMSSGLDCDDGNDESPGNEDRMQSQSAQPDWAAYTLDLPLIHPPGAVAAYCSGGMNLAGAVIARAAGAWLPDVFHDRLAEPLGIADYRMNLMPTGEAYAGGGLRVRGRDFLKLGQLMLDRGRWRGSQVLPPGWVEGSLTRQAEIWDESYGLGWWLITYPYQGREVEAFYAGGNGGQYIIGVPDLDLLVVFFGGNYSQRVMHVSKREYLPAYILAAIRQPEPDPIERAATAAE